MAALFFLMGVAAIIFFRIYPPTQEAKKYRIQKLGQETRKVISDLTDKFMKESIEIANEKENENGHKS